MVGALGALELNSVNRNSLAFGAVCYDRQPHSNKSYHKTSLQYYNNILASHSRFIFLHIVITSTDSIMISLKESEEKDCIFDGFKFGLVPYKIMDMRKSSDTNKFFFAVTWIDHEHVECLDAETVRAKCPKLLCKYYESIINGRDNGCTYQWKIFL